jgi:hypothetical protein
MDLADYRGDAEEFLAALTLEYYRHYAGLQTQYAIEPIYTRYAHLFTSGAVLELRSAFDAGIDGSEERRRLALLLDFAVEGYVGEATKGLEAELASREAELVVELGGGTVGFRDVPVLQANEPDADRRRALELARLELLDRELNGLYRELVEHQHAAATALGWPSYAAMCADCKHLDLAELHAQTEAFAAGSEEAYPRLLQPHLEQELGYGFERLQRSDLPRFFRAPGQDTHYPVGQLVPALRATLADLGIELDRQTGLTLDIETRSGKTPRAFCAPVRVPNEVYLVLAPHGGRDDFSVLFHEAGHAEHFSWVDPGLAFEFRCLGDNAVTEGFAFLLQHLSEEPAWLRRHLGVREPGELVAHAQSERLVYLRRYTAKLAYELELHGPGGGPSPAMAGRYAELMTARVGARWTPQSYLADVDAGFYSACYLRAWAFEAQLRAHLVERFGPGWFAAAEAGALLRSLWSEGQRRSPGELLGELTGEELSFEPLLAELTAS